MDDRRMEAAQTRLNRVSERAQDFASDAGEQLSHYGERMGPYMEQAKRFVQDRPLQAIALQPPSA